MPNQSQPIKDDIKAILNEEQLSEILLVIDKKNQTVNAVKDIKDGIPELVAPGKDNKNEFMHIGQNSDALDIAITAIKNFYRQSRDPTEFKILKVPLNVFNGIKNTTALFRELLKDKPSKKVSEFTEKHLVDTTSVTNKQIINEKKETMAKKETNTETQTMPVENERKPRFQEGMIDWATIEKYGISRQYLQDKGLLENMMKGYKTSQLVPISINLGAATIRTDARLSFQQSTAGPLVLAIHGLRKEPQLQQPYFGHIFSEDDKKNLRESGNMGRAVDLTNRAGQTMPYLISIDKLTNEIVATRADRVFVPDEVKGVKLNDQDKQDLREGKKLWVEGMTSGKGTSFDAYIQINADRRGIEYSFPERDMKMEIIGGVTLSPQQQKDLSEGRAIFVEDMERKDGELFSAFIKRDEATKNLSYTRYNPDSPEGAREIYIPKEIGGVKLESDEREALRKGLPIFLDGMINRRGEEYSSYIKADLETGRLSYARKPDGFAQRETFKIPAEVFGKTLNATQRAQLQDGKSVLVEGMKGYDGKPFNSYIKVNPNQAKLDFYNENPDKPKRNQTNTAAEENKNKQNQTATTKKRNSRKVS